MSIALAAIAVALLVAAGFTDVPEIRLTVDRSVPVSTIDRSAPLVRSHEAPSVVADRDERSILYASGVDLRSGACQFWVSADGAQSWQPETVPSLEPYTRNCGLGSSQPHNLRTELVQAPDGRLYYAFQGNSPDAGGPAACSSPVPTTAGDRGTRRSCSQEHRRRRMPTRS